ncbi:hypothetical protein [Desulfosporosinus fructosivorans]
MRLRRYSPPETIVPDSPSLARLAAAHILVRCPVFGVAYTEVCYSAFVKDVALVSHCVSGLGGERFWNSHSALMIVESSFWGDGGIWETAHFMCAVLSLGSLDKLAILIAYWRRTSALQI